MQVICDTYTPAGEPIPTNKRARAAEIFSSPKVINEVPWWVSSDPLVFCSSFLDYSEDASIDPTRYKERERHSRIFQLVLMKCGIRLFRQIYSCTFLAREMNFIKDGECALMFGHC